VSKDFTTWLQPTRHGANEASAATVSHEPQGALPLDAVAAPRREIWIQVVSGSRSGLAPKVSVGLTAKKIPPREREEAPIATGDA
jgi:hypothetical protein